MKLPVLSAFCLSTACATFAQSRVETGSATLHEGFYVDLDTGTVLSKPRLESVRAEWRMEVEAGVVRIVPCEGATVAVWDGRLGEDGTEPDPETFSDKPIKVKEVASLAGRSSEGRPYKALLTPAWPASLRASASEITWGAPVEVQVDFAIAPGTEPGPSPARKLQAHFTGGQGVVRWDRGATERWKVEWFRAGVEKADGSAEVTGSRADLAGLAEGQVYRVEVRPISENGMEGEPRVVPLFAGETGPLHVEFEASMKEAYQPGVGLDRRGGRATDSDPDCLFTWGIVRAPEGGGVIWLGETQAEFDRTDPLPAFGYRTRVLARGTGGVYAVRMRDGRLAKVWFDWHSQRRLRELGPAVKALVLAGGGRGFNAPPGGLKGRFADGRVRLEWRVRGEAMRYVVDRRDGAASVALGETSACEFEDEKPPMFGAPAYLVSWINAEGIHSAPAVVIVETWPEEYDRGSSSIDRIRGGFDFRTHTPSGNFPQRQVQGDTDFHFDEHGISADGRSLVCEGGIAEGTPDGFGRFDWRDAIRFRKRRLRTRVTVPHRLAEPVTFRLLTRDGGYAHIRLEQDARFAFRVSWVHLAQPKSPDLATMRAALLEKAPAVTFEEAKEFQALVAQLGAEEAGERDAATRKLGEAGLKAVRTLLDALDGSMDAEVRVRTQRILEDAFWELE